MRNCLFLCNIGKNLKAIYAINEYSCFQCLLARQTVRRIQYVRYERRVNQNYEMEKSRMTLGSGAACSRVGVSIKKRVGGDFEHLSIVLFLTDVDLNGWCRTLAVDFKISF